MAQETWNMDPPAQGEIKVLVALGEDARVPTELRDMLNRLGTELSEPEVGGFGMIRVYEPEAGTLDVAPKQPEVQWSQWSIGF